MELRHKVKTIILDVDGTLSEEISWWKLTQGLGASVEKHSEIFERFKSGLLSYKKARIKLVNL